MPRTSTSPIDSALVGEAIRHRRSTLGLTQSELAKRLDVSTAYIHKLEAGYGNPTVGALARVARALDASLLVELTSEPRGPAADALSILRG